ncbi:hypothetical protein GUJ93_ZPchr0009g891 [Zizania palustris]|uniref:Uncharacterized protein n=1 Tax=Zizania palustris TaxID=103762 RepID=A0A8J5RGF5_ZIZPA|nr:hypothetical protein GUJ93_ZPchr0009g891 [Zizania palustris]
MKASGGRAPGDSGRWGLALSNEAAVNALCGELQLALDTQAHFDEKQEEEAETSTSTKRLRAPRSQLL